jgi:hypothetical protein
MTSIAPQSEQRIWTNLLGNEGRARRLIRDSGILGALIILIIVLVT